MVDWCKLAIYRFSVKGTKAPKLLSGAPAIVDAECKSAVGTEDSDKKEKYFHRRREKGG